MGKKEMLSVVSGDNNENIVKLVAYFTLIKNECDYLAYTEYDNDSEDDENVKVYVGRVEIGDNKIYLRTVSEEDEIDSVKDVLVGLSNNPEEGFDYKIYKDIKNIFVLKEIFINNIMDNYEFIISKQDEIFKYLDTNSLFIDIIDDDSVSYDKENNDTKIIPTTENNDNVDNTNHEYLRNSLTSINNIINSISIPTNDDNSKDITNENKNQSIQNIQNEQSNENNAEYNMNDVDVEKINIPPMDEPVDIQENNIPIDTQIKLDLNNEKIKYLNILKKEIDNEIEKLEAENNNLYNN